MACTVFDTTLCVLVLICCSSAAIFRDRQKWPQVCEDPYEFCFGEFNNVTTSSIFEGCLLNVTSISSGISYNSDCRILLRVSLSLDDDDEQRDVRWSVRIPSDWNYVHLTMWFSPESNLTTNEGCHSIKIIDDKKRPLTKGYGYFKFDGYNFETDQAFGDQGIIALKSRYFMINLKEKFHGNENFPSNFTNSSLINFIWFNFRSLSILEVERFGNESINLIRDKLFIYLTLKGEDESGTTVQIISRRSEEATIFFPIQVADDEVGLADSTKLAILALVAFCITMIVLGIYVCLTRERHEENWRGVDVTRDEPNQELKSKDKANAERRLKIKKHDESHVSTGGFHVSMDHHSVPH